MGRFTHLEWRGPGSQRSPVGGASSPPAAAGGLEPGLVRDEEHWLAEAAKEERAGRFERALRLYSRALEVDPNHPVGWVGQVRMLVELGELTEAALWADKGLDVHRDHAGLLSAKAQAVARAGDPDRGIALHDAAMKQRGASAHVWLARGELILALGKGGEEHCFEKARVEARGDAAIQVAAARTYLGYGHPALALAWAEGAVRRDAKYALAWRVKGEAESALGLADLALRSLATAIDLDPQCPGARDMQDALRRTPLLARLRRRVCALFRSRRPRR